jgi:hypothetical protein
MTSAQNYSLFPIPYSPYAWAMPKREVDKRKTRKALRKLRRAAERASDEGGPGLTEWEKDFVNGVTGRLEKYGSAFRDPGKGRLEEALSQRQAHVTRVLDKKSRSRKSGEDGPPQKKPLRSSTLKRKTPLRPRRPPRVLDVNEDLADPTLTPGEKRAALRLIPGGKPPGRGR